MFIFKYIRHILIISCQFELSFANLKFCPKPGDQPSNKEAFVCLTNETGYSAPFPINLGLNLYFNNVIKIDEDSNSISIQAELWTYWNDPGLDHNHECGSLQK